MLITQTVQTKIRNKKQMEYYSKIVPNANIGDIITIATEQLIGNSSVMVDVKCDYCGNEFSREWSRIFSGRKVIQKDSCSKCRSLKYKEVCLAKYGVENPAQLPEVQEKMKNTNLKKYGCENAMQNKEIYSRAQQTCLERFGTKNCMQNKDIQQKAKNTCLERYGSESYAASEQGKEQITSTNMKRYGCKYPFQSDEIQKKAIETSQEKYGVDYPIMCKEIKEKSQNTLYEHYGVFNPAESPELLAKMMESFHNKYGVNGPAQIEEFRLKACKTMTEKYGAPYTMQSEILRKKATDTCVDRYGVDCLFKDPDFREAANKVKIERYGEEYTKTSATQRHLSEIFNCSMNLPIGKYFADLNIGNSIIVEYDGGFHDGAVKMGYLTKEQFQQKELVREDFIISRGYKIIRIINSLDTTIDDSEYIRIKDNGIELLNNSDYSVYYYDVNTNVKRYR